MLMWIPCEFVREMPTEPKWNFTCWNCPDASQPAVYAPTA